MAADITPTAAPREATPLTTFTLFPNLPTELRLKIYTHILALSPSTPILKISYSPSPSRYISNTAPPITLSLCSDSRTQTLLSWSHLALGAPLPSPRTCLSSPSHIPCYPIPICYSTQTLYLSGLSPILATHLHEIFFHLSTSAARHKIEKLAIDLRVWNELCENGFLTVVGRMKKLREVDLVVEFGRKFEGELGFIEAPEWRSGEFIFSFPLTMRFCLRGARRQAGQKIVFKLMNLVLGFLLFRARSNADLWFYRLEVGCRESWEGSSRGEGTREVSLERQSGKGL
jgi:hypothetical protein